MIQFKSAVWKFKGLCFSGEQFTLLQKADRLFRLVEVQLIIIELITCFQRAPESRMTANRKRHFLIAEILDTVFN